MPYGKPTSPWTSFPSLEMTSLDWERILKWRLLSTIASVWARIDIWLLSTCFTRRIVWTNSEKWPSRRTAKKGVRRERDTGDFGGCIWDTAWTCWCRISYAMLMRMYSSTIGSTRNSIRGLILASTGNVAVGTRCCNGGRIGFSSSTCWEDSRNQRERSRYRLSEVIINGLGLMTVICFQMGRATSFRRPICCKLIWNVRIELGKYDIALWVEFYMLHWQNLDIIKLSRLHDTRVEMPRIKLRKDSSIPILLGVTLRNVLSAETPPGHGFKMQ